MEFPVLDSQNTNSIHGITLIDRSHR